MNVAAKYQEPFLLRFRQSRLNMRIDQMFLFTGSYVLVDVCSRIANIGTVYCEAECISIELNDICALYGIPLAVIRERQDLFFPEKNSLAYSIGISYGFSVIFSESEIVRFTHGIWNIHPGKLPDNRGRHPIPWTFLKNEKNAYLSLHQINRYIDRGRLLAERQVPVLITDNSRSLAEKLEGQIDQELLFEAMRNFDAGDAPELGKGTYNGNLSEIMTTPDLCSLESAAVFNVVRSQAIYGGVNYSGRRYTECHYYHPLLFPDSASETLITCQDGVCLVLR